MRISWGGTVHGRAAAALGALALGAALTACSGGGGARSAEPPNAPPGRGGAATSESGRPTTHPFDGGTEGLDNPVLAVKIANTERALPQTGVQAADIVYVEQVEGGATRLMAMYSSELPERVGPVRSARISDLHILEQFGRPAFAFSGVQGKMKPHIRKAPSYDVSQENSGSAYFRAGPKSIPYNLYADPRDLLEQAPEATGPRDIGFRFGPAPDGGKPMESFTAEWPSVTMGFTWSDEKERWLASWNGRPDVATDGTRLGGATVVVQYVKTSRSKFHDSLGHYTPLIETTGTGRALVLRDGKGYDARWSRPSGRQGTTFTTAGGDPMTFARGQVWVLLVNEDGPVIP